MMNKLRQFQKYLETHLSELKSNQIKKLGGYTQEEFLQGSNTYNIHIKTLEKDIELLESQIKASRDKKFPHNSLKEFATKKYGLAYWRKYHTAVQNGSRSSRQLHSYLKVDTETFIKYTQEAVAILKKSDRKTFLTADVLVYTILEYFNQTYNPKGNYKNDVGDVWASAKEILDEYLDIGRIRDDCDGFGIFLFTLIDAALSFTFPEERHRLKAQLCYVTGEYHFNLLWLRGDDINDWCVIETTVWPEDNLKFFNNLARNQNYMRTVAVFDREKEYRLKM